MKKIRWPLWATSSSSPSVASERLRLLELPTIREHVGQVGVEVDRALLARQVADQLVRLAQVLHRAFEVTALGQRQAAEAEHVRERDQLAALLRRLHHGLEEAVDLVVELRVHQRRHRARDRHRGHALDQWREHGRLGELRHPLAAEAAPGIEVAERREHHRAADVAGQRVFVRLIEQRACDLVDVRVEAGRVDQLRFQHLPQLRLLVLQPFDRPLEDRHSLRPAVEAEQGASELQREPGVAQRLFGCGECFLQVPCCREHVHALLRQAELGERVDPRLVRRRLGQRAPELPNGDLGRAADERAVGGHAQCLDHEGVARGRQWVEVRCDPFGLGMRGVEQLGGAAVRVQALRRFDRLVDRGSHDRMGEFDCRRRHAQQVGPVEPGGGERG